MKLLELRELLIKMSRDPNIKKTPFVIESKYKYLGISQVELRKIAKQIAKEGYKELLSDMEFFYFDETIVIAYLIGYLKNHQEAIKYSEEFIPLIDNWATNDSYCQNMTICRKYPKEMLKFFLSYMDDSNTYSRRVILVVLLSHYLNDTYIDEVIRIMKEITGNEYYFEMAYAWLLATILAKYENIGYEFITNYSLSSFVYKKSIQKALESFRVSSEMKEKLRLLR